MIIDMSESYIRAYWQDICEGRAIVGYYVRRQVELLIADLDNPELKIDFAESEKRIRFIERECRHSEAPFAGKPFIKERRKTPSFSYGDISREKVSA